MNIQYESLLQNVLDNGQDKTDRTGTGTRSIFGAQMRFDLSESFPLITTKKVFWKGVVCELLWFLRGDTNVKFLHQHGVKIWDAWADKNGNCPHIYGEQWRKWRGSDGKIYDQITNVVNQIKTNPDSRRLIVSAWNVAEIDTMALPPCHAFFQFYVNDGKLSCQLYQRSCDLFLGVPFNIASYSLLTHMIAQQCDLAVGDFVWTGGDCHIYKNHFEQVRLQLSREPRPFPQLKILRKPVSVFDYSLEDFELIGYDPHPAIKAPVSV